MTRKNFTPCLIGLFFSSGIILALFLWQGALGFNLADEGFLWYGAQRVLQGEVPIRDFQSYDPGRYYWGAAWMALRSSSSIMALRESAAVFQALGLFIGLALLIRYSPKQNILFWGLAAVTLAVWMFPRHKLFDVSLSIALVGIYAFLISRPTGRRFFLAGTAVGLAAVFGRNHGLYGLAAGLGIMIYLALQQECRTGWIRALGAWAAGLTVGYLPVLLLITAAPGFGSAFWESIRFLFELQATNLPLPVPFPWRVPFEQLTVIDAGRGLLVGCLFIALWASGLAGLIWVFHRQQRHRPVSPALAAAVFLMPPYAHYAYSRADVNHLAQGIFPLLLGVWALFAHWRGRFKWPAALLVCSIALLVMLPWHPGWQNRFGQPWVETVLAGDRLRIDPATADDVNLLHRLAREFAPAGRSFIATPFWPGAYAVLERKSPLWEIYALFPRSVPFQEAELDRLKSAPPGFVIVLDYPLDGREDLRFGNTHPLLNRYFNEHFENLHGYANNPALKIFRP